MISVLVTGGTGFVGRTFIKQMGGKFDIIPPVGSAVLNYCNWEKVQTLPRADIIVHLAAKTFVPAADEDPRSFYETNFLSTLNVLEKARKDNSRVIFFSSYVYGKPQYLPVDEKHPITPANAYSYSKWLSEELCRAFHQQYQIPTFIFRPFNIYGPGQSNIFVISKIVDQAKYGHVLLQDPAPKRDFVYIDDVSDAVSSAIEFLSNNTGIYTVNLGSGVSFSINEICKIFQHFLPNLEIDFEQIPRINDVNETVADIGKIKKLLDWNPKTTMEMGIKKILESHGMIENFNFSVKYPRH